ncbi:MAG: NAD(P)-dependent oxidoreductase [Bacteroidales bacterium]
MKRVTIIGATGFVGSSILNEALSRGYYVRALVRNPDKLNISNPNLEIIKADITDESSLTNLLSGEESIISAYNPGWTNPNIYDETLRVYPIILNASKRASIKRILIVGGAGTLFVAPNLRVVDTGAIPAEILGAVKSLGEFYLNTLMNENEIDWVFFSPAGNLAPGERTGKYRLGKDDLIVDEKGNSNISVEDYAKAMIDELEIGSHHKERFTIGY